MPMGLFTNVHRLRLTDAKHLFLRVLLGCLSVLAVAFACPHSFGAAERVVSGIVIDSAGFEVANASVQAMPRKEEKNGGTVGSLSWMKTDSHGRFSLRLSSGRYKIVATDIRIQFLCLVPIRRIDSQRSPCKKKISRVCGLCSV